MKKAIKMYKAFQGHEPRDIGQFKSSFFIPEVVFLAGPAVNVLYRSKKNDPSTGAPMKRAVDYIHDHDKGVNVYRCDAGIRGREKRVPSFICDVKELVLLGECLGFCYHDGENDVEASPTRPYPELYTIPSGRALLVIQGKQRVLAIIWGGRLGVEARGSFTKMDKRDSNGVGVIAVLIKDVDRHEQLHNDTIKRVTAIEISVAALSAKVALYAALGATVGGIVVGFITSYFLK